MIYLTSFPNTDSLHTIINKKTSEGWTYIVAIGYGGGGVHEHFSGKFRYDEELDDYVGFRDDHSDPEQWNYEIQGTEKSMTETPLTEADAAIISEMVSEIWEHVHYADEDQLEIKIKDEFTKTTENDCYLHQSEDWDDDVVNWISSEAGWGLTIKFDW
jgi:hypothetical protein